MQLTMTKKKEPEEFHMSDVNKCFFLCRQGFSQEMLKF